MDSRVRAIADALSERVPIDWSVVLSESWNPAQRRALASLQSLDRLCRQTTAKEPLRTWAWTDAVWTVVAIASTAIIASTVAVVSWVEVRGMPHSPWPAPQAAIVGAHIAAALLLFRGRADHRVRPLLAAYLSIAAALCWPFLGRVEAGAELATYGVFPEAFLPACMWAFALRFPRTTRLSRFDRYARIVATAAMALSVALFCISVSVARFKWAHMFRPLARQDRSWWFWLMLGAATAAAVTCIFIRARRADADERRRTRRFAWALTAGSGPFLLLMVAMLVSPPFRAWMALGQRPERWPVDVPVLGGLLALPLLTAGAVVADRTFQLQAWLRRGTQYALTRATLLTATLIPLALLGVLVYRQRDFTVRQIAEGQSARVLALAAVVAFLSLSVRARLQRIVDALFFRSIADPRVQFSQALERVRHARSRREVMASLVDAVRASLGTARVAIFVKDQGQQRLVSALDDTPSIEMAPSLLTFVHGNAGPTEVATESVLIRMVDADDRGWLERHGFRIFVPVARRDGTLLAIIAAGPKGDRFPLTGDDTWLLRNLSTAAASALDDTDDRRWNVGGSDDSAFECVSCGCIAASRDIGCGCAAATRVAALPPVLHGKFRLVRRLGRGGMGVVYLARDMDLDREVALKTLPGVTADAIIHLRAEARGMASLSHPSIGGLYGLELWRDTPVLVVEYLKGGTLAGRLRAGPMELGDVLRLGLALSRGLETMHAGGLVHRDVKPSNIGLTEAGAPKLLDFGLVNVAGGVEGLAGTALYLPIEAVESAAVGAAIDLWALNVVLFEAVAGVHPFQGNDWRAIRRKIATGPPELGRHRQVSDAVSRYFCQALAVDPGKRPQTAGEVADRLTEIEA